MLNVLDLFSGIGGFSYGLEKTGHFQTVGFCENDPKPVMVLNKHWPNVPVFGNIQDLNATVLHEHNIYPDLLCGGFPCQDISASSHTREGLKGERSGLWYEYKRLINDVRPRFAIIENVAMLQSRGLDQILYDLAEIGYDATWTMFDSQYFGTPQRRRRFYILACRDGIPIDCDPFDCAGRSGQDGSEQISLIEEGRRGSIEAASKKQMELAFFTRQRTAHFDIKGVMSTFMKRDHKDYTDLIVQSDGIVRKVMPHERIRVHGFPDDWLDDLGLSVTDQYKYCGMSTQTVKYVGECLVKSGLI